MKKLARRFLFPNILWISEILRRIGRKNLVHIYYHGVTTKGYTHRHMSADMFREHLEYYARHFDVIRMTDKPKRKSISISFDDGFANNLHTALPILEKYNFPVTIFVSACITEGVERLYTDDPYKSYPEEVWKLLTNAELIELSKHPLVTIGSHGWKHHRITNQNYFENIILSRMILGYVIQQRVGLFSYPFGITPGEDIAKGYYDKTYPLKARHCMSATTTVESNMFFLNLKFL